MLVDYLDEIQKKDKFCLFYIKWNRRSCDYRRVPFSIECKILEIEITDKIVLFLVEEEFYFNYYFVFCRLLFILHTTLR
jgi:hypothetical protein